MKCFLKWTVRVVVTLLLVAALVLFIAYWRSTNDCERYSAVPANPVKVVAYCEYGSADVLALKEIEKPVPADDEVLVKVKAVSLNPADGTYHGGARIVTGLRKPEVTRFGIDYAGTVEAVGKSVTQFKVGDDVFGGKTGAAAQYICVREARGIVPKPADVTFEEAAAVPVAAITALQGLRDKGKIAAGQKVLVNGASGGVGTFAVQIAKAFGAEVTAICSTRNVEMVRKLGADRVIDYTKEDFTTGAARYDLIFDLVGNHSFKERRRILTENGICVMAGIGGAGWHDGVLGRLGGELYAYLRSRFLKQKFIAYIAQLNKNDLGVLAGWMQDGKIKPVIDRQFSLEQVPQAMRYLEEGHARGKVIVTVDSAPAVAPLQSSTSN